MSDDPVTVVSTPRDGEGLERTVVVPNWPSDAHRISIHIPDHTNERWVEHAGYPPSVGQ